MTQICELEPGTSEEVADKLVDRANAIAQGIVFCSRVIITKISPSNIVSYTYGAEFVYSETEPRALPLIVSLTAQIKKYELIYNLAYDNGD